MCSGCKAPCFLLFQGMGQGLALFSERGILPNTTGQRHFSPISEFLGKKLPTSLRHIMSPCSVKLRI